MECVSADLGAEPCNCCGRMSRGYESIVIYAINCRYFIQVISKNGSKMFIFS